MKITSITAQRDMKSLVKYLLNLPGLNSDRVSRGLKILPFEILSVEQEAEARKMQADIEKFGALCVVENTEAVSVQKSTAKKNAISSNKDKKSHKMFYLIVGIIIMVIIAIGLSFDYDTSSKEKYSPNPQKKQQPIQQAPQQPYIEHETKAAGPAKSNEELKKDINKNPYNPDTWKAISENLELAGDTAAARKAKESYEKAIRTQRALSGLAKAFGSNVRVEITEDAVYYRTDNDFKTESDFHYEAAQLRDSLSVKFPGKKLIIENYSSDNKIQRVELEP